MSLCESCGKVVAPANAVIVISGDDKRTYCSLPIHEGELSCWHAAVRAWGHVVALAGGPTTAAPARTVDIGSVAGRRSEVGTTA